MPGYYRTGITGGTTTDLDGIDGALLTAGDEFAIVPNGSDMYFYKASLTSGAAANPPYIVEPTTNAGTKRWILQQIPWKADVGEIFFHSNLVRDPQRLAWSICNEAKIGTGYIIAPTLNSRFGVSPFSGATAWTAIGYTGAVSQVITDDTYATVVDITSGAGVLTNIVLPGVTSASDIVYVKVTIDGIAHELSFTADNATDRVVSGLIESISTYSNDTCRSMWPDNVANTSLATRLPEGIEVYHSIAQPSCSIGGSPCLRWLDSIKIEMKSTDVSTASYRNYCGAAYKLDQY